MISATIIADSVNPIGNRLTTFILEFPRWILAELNTHRMLSRNVASSRAIKIEKMIEMVENNPAMPVFWGKNQAGMQSEEELSREDLENAKNEWLKARDKAVESAKNLYAAGLHKQYVNRTIENFMYVRAIVSATEWGNFFALRAHRDAQPEISCLAYKMLDEYNKNKPKELKGGEWHIPFGENISYERITKEIIENRDVEWKSTVFQNNLWEEAKQKIAIARCARISFYNFEGKDDYVADLKLCDRLFGSIPRHLSPTEHVARAQQEDKFIGNFKGWEQYRKFFPEENLLDNRIK